MPLPASVSRVALVALAAAPLAAQERPGPLAAMARCRAIVAADARAGCYDAAWDALQAARADKRVVVLEEGEVRAARRGLFGFGGLRLPGLGGDTDAPESLEATVSTVDDLAAGRHQFTLADGAVWQTTEPPRAGIGPRAGTAVTIRRGAVGNYLARFGRSNAPVRVRRIR